MFRPNKVKIAIAANIWENLNSNKDLSFFGADKDKTKSSDGWFYMIMGF